MDASPVFATLLSLPARDADPIALTGDTASDVRVFLAALASTQQLAKAPVQDLLGVARLAHKFECDALAAAAFRFVLDAMREFPAPAALLADVLAVTARFGPEAVDAVASAFLARRNLAAVNRVSVLAACDAAHVHAPALRGWALYALACKSRRRDPHLARALRMQLMLGETALRALPPLCWSVLAHNVCARAWANAWPEDAVAGRVEVLRALHEAEQFTVKKTVGLVCGACIEVAAGEVQRRVRWLERNMWQLFEDEGIYASDLS